MSPLEIETSLGVVYMGEYQGVASATNVAGDKVTVPPDLKPRFAFRRQSPSSMWVATMDLPDGILVEATLQEAGGKVDGVLLMEGAVKEIGKTKFTGLPKIG